MGRLRNFLLDSANAMAAVPFRCPQLQSLNDQVPLGGVSAVGDRRGIGRYGFLLPMDESLAQVAIDLSGRPAFVFEADFPRDRVGQLSTEMVRHFFASLSQALGAALHLQVKGENTHHMIEALFKGTGRALRPALQRQGRDLPSTKGVL